MSKAVERRYFLFIAYPPLVFQPIIKKVAWAVFDTETRKATTIYLRALYSKKRQKSIPFIKIICKIDKKVLLPLEKGENL
jgi:hypothetical protein